MFASNFMKFEQTRRIPHLYVVVGILLADARLAAFAVGMWRRSRAGAGQQVGKLSKYFTPAVILALPLLMAMPLRRNRGNSPFPPRYQIVGDAVGVVVAGALFICLMVTTVRFAKLPPAEKSPELLEE